MKALYLLLFFTSLCYTQKREAIITFVDSTTFDGYAELCGSNRIKFRTNLEDKPDKLGPKEILQVEFIGAFDNEVYRYVRYRSSSGVNMLLKVLEEGPITLYAKESKRAVGGGLHNPADGSFQHGSYEFEKYYSSFYLFRQDESKLYLYRGKKTLLECFEDCSVVKERVESDDYDDQNFEDLVWEYNYDCGWYLLK